MSSIIVIKQNIQGEEVWRYQGEVLKRTEHFLVLKAFFDRDDSHFYGMNLCRGDRFIEWYYTDCWYNIFEIHDRNDNHLKGWYCNISTPAQIDAEIVGWYCNISTPAQIDAEIVVYQDLALDLLIFPDGRQLVLDEEEFNALTLPPALRENARNALKILQLMFKEKESAGISNALFMKY